MAERRDRAGGSQRLDNFCGRVGVWTGPAVNLDDDDAPLDVERPSSTPQSEQRSEPRPDDEKLSIFRDFINTLDSDEFDRGRGD